MEYRGNSDVFSFEKSFDDMTVPHYLVNHWTDSIVYSVLYVSIIFSLKAWMKNRSKFELRTCLMIWNCALSIFSTFGFIRILPELLESFRLLGLRGSLCTRVSFKGVLGYWSFYFSASKLFEFGDTLFIILRKQKLILLHWYHHITTLIFTWYCYSHRTGLTFVPMTMNFGVHSIMYTYYLLKSLKITVPKLVSMVITLLQIVQMFIGFAVMCVAYSALRQHPGCYLRETAVISGLLMYLSYIVLFIKFFCESYLLKPKKDAVKTH